MGLHRRIDGFSALYFLPGDGYVFCYLEAPGSSLLSGAFFSVRSVHLMRVPFKSIGGKSRYVSIFRKICIHT